MHASSITIDARVLAVDVGGTNTSCAILDVRAGAFSPVFERRYSTKAEPSLMAPLSRFMSEAAASGAPAPALLCVSGAGPVEGRSIRLTNAPWGIDGDELAAKFGLETFVINDFSAIAWGVLLLDPKDPSELVQLPRPDGCLVEADDSGPVYVLGAGTGLGAGFVLRDSGVARVYPSEGGHVSLPVYDDDTRAFSLWLEKKYGFAPGAEAGVSGQGIGHLFSFLAEQDRSQSPTVRSILAIDECDRPAAIAAADDPLCARAMDMFVRLYARVACDAAASFLPTGGIYLAGGIAAKNQRLFTEGDRFMSSFGLAYREHIRAIAERTPVFIVKDYAISIFGAAHAAISLAHRRAPGA